jgi:type II secretory pathway component PulF
MRKYKQIGYKRKERRIGRKKRINLLVYALVILIILAGIYLSYVYVLPQLASALTSAQGAANTTGTTISMTYVKS